MHVGEIGAELRFDGRAVIAHAEAARRDRQHFRQQQAVAHDAEDVPVARRR